jgi:hypothetical protein
VRPAARRVLLAREQLLDDVQARDGRRDGGTECARVGVGADGATRAIEFELIEPALFLDRAPHRPPVASRKRPSDG